MFVFSANKINSVGETGPYSSLFSLAKASNPQIRLDVRSKMGWYCKYSLSLPIPSAISIISSMISLSRATLRSSSGL